MQDFSRYMAGHYFGRSNITEINVFVRIREAAKIGLATLEHLTSAEDLDNIALTDDFKDTQVCQRSKITLSNTFSKVGTVEKAKEMIVDMLTMIGQADVATTQTREVSLHPRLNREFVSSLKSLDRKGTKVTRFEANKLFHERLDDVVSRRSKETGLKRILAPARAYNGRSEGWYENSRYTIWELCILLSTLSQVEATRNSEVDTPRA